jgi:DNA-binding NtrC family response regulator
VTEILVIDDDAELLQSLIRSLRSLVHPRAMCGAGTAEDAKRMVRTENPQVVVLDLCIDPRTGVESGFALLRELREIDPHMRVIVVTGHGCTEYGVRALDAGAASFIEKPADVSHLAALIKDAAAQATMRREHARFVTAAAEGVSEPLCGGSSVMRALRERINFLAGVPQSVLITGETGTGKGLCARLIHERSDRRSERFVNYQPNFGGGDIVQSELFGHVRGAFTGAAETRRGLILDADGGSLFIDELDEVPHEVQVKLLDVLQERRIRPVGADGFHSVDCRFIAATNRDVGESIASGRIRRDLHHRIAQSVLRVPSLRERREDIPELCSLFLKRIREREYLNVFECSPTVLAALRERVWEGNVRELQGVVETAAYHAHYRHCDVVEPRDVQAVHATYGEENEFREESQSYHDRVERFKVTLIEQALERTGGNQVHAAKLLGLDRGTVRRALSKSGTLR